jgi:uncharacterized membrane protein
MSWLHRYYIRHYVSNSIWVLPFLGMLVALIAVPVVHWIDQIDALAPGAHPDTALAVLGTMASAMFTFIVFVSTALLVAVQLASSQLTPRIIGIVFKDPVTRLSLAVFVCTFTFTLSAMVRIKENVPLITFGVAAYGCMVSLAVFLFMIDHVGKALRPSGALRATAWLGRRVIEDVYRRRLADPSVPNSGSGEVPVGEPMITVSSQDGVLMAFDIEGLVGLAEKHDCIIAMVPQVGDCVAVGDPLFRVFHWSHANPPTLLGAHVAIGQERTLEQDPTFAFRIMVDVASKGLSPAINDPTTAVLAIDQIHQLLRNVGNRYLDNGRVCDKQGKLRLIYRTPDWEDFVHLAVTEIRQFGSLSIQVARRLRAMLEDLIQTVPETRAELLHRELNLLQRSAARFFVEPEDRALAEVSDFQGVGGKPGRTSDTPQIKRASRE